MVTKRTRSSRREFIGGAAATTATIVALRAAEAQTETKIEVVGVPIDVSAQPYYAQNQSFFKKVGLDADVTTLGNGAQIISALLGEKIDFGAGGTTSIALAHERGLPIVIAAPAGSYSKARRTHGMVVRADSPIRRARDLAGRTAGTAGLKTLGDLCFHAWMEKNGLDPTSVNLIEMPYAAQIAALGAGRIDAADLEEPYLTAALAQGNRFFANVFDAVAPQWVEGAFFCTESYAREHPDVVRKFAAAMALAAEWGNRNPVEAWKVLDQYSHGETAPGTPHCIYTGRLHARDFQPLIDKSAEFGFIKKAFPASDLFAPGLDAS